ncbi:protein TonB [Sphingomonas kyeonggiensis]|uniref:Protein TonB n=1 Tax=Sphingomonas kyeonggiensis TaxID=1268553 RepID=A0A7W7K180_9SPHN|nr:energy transducer TonB [Sphingomonas kyeonggiensis]MBB4838843.1 protein TonB [Sphingomonas kyeonggiensis]
MPLNRNSILISAIAGLACALIAPAVASAQTAPPRTTGDANRPGGFVTAPTARPAVPMPAARKRAKRPLKEPISPRLLGLAIGPDDYPVSLIRAGAQGRVIAVVQISASGQATGCEIAQSTGYPDLDAHSCAIILQRAQFEPARDEYGDPVASSVRAPINWQIPE